MSSSKIDPICGMQGTLEHYGHWFCSPGCVEKYEVREGIHACESVHFPWWKHRALWAISIMAFVLMLGWLWQPARPVSHVLSMYLSQSGIAILAGLFVGGLIDHFIPKEYISIWLARKNKRTVLVAAGLGFMASSCSHGCLALTVELYRKGASVSSAITFLLASPWASLSLTFLLVSLLGPQGIGVILCAFLISITTGMIFQRLEEKRILDPNPHTKLQDPNFSIAEDFRKRWLMRTWNLKMIRDDFIGILRGMLTLADMVIPWVAVGLIFTSLFGGLLPPGWWGRFLGPNLLGLLTTMGLATIIEVCSEGTAPIAVEIFRQTGALGNAFAFLMGGVVTDMTELTMLWSNLGRKVVFWLLVVTLPQVFVIGYLLNLISHP